VIYYREYPAIVKPAQHTRAAKYHLLEGCLRFLYGKREFPEYIPYKIISFLKREIEIKPTPYQYANYFFYLTLFNHVGLGKQFLYQMSEILFSGLSDKLLRLK